MASTIYGNIRDISRFQRVVNGTIKLINGPISEDPYLIFPTTISIQTNSEGYFECSLGLGDYTLTIGTDEIQFSVTEDGGNFNIITLVTTEISYTRQPYSSQWNGILDHRHIQFLFVNEPEEPVGTVVDCEGTTGLEDDVDYGYKLTYVTASGETIPSESAGFNGSYASDNKAISIALPLNPVNVVKTRIWRTASAVDAFTYYMLAELDPTVETYVDSESNADFTARKDDAIVLPTTNTTAGGMYANNILLSYFSLNGLDIKNRFRLPDALTAGIGNPILDREISIQSDENGVWLQLRYNSGDYRFRAADRINQSISFDRSDSPLDGEYIGGRHRFAVGGLLATADIVVRNRPLTGNLEITAEIDGDLNTNFKFTVTPGSGEFTQALDLATLDPTGLDYLGGTYLRWKVTANANAVEDSATGVFITESLAVNIQ